MIKIAFFNCKGGVGKTTGIYSFCGVLAKQGKKVLTVDMDKQTNLTSTLLMNSVVPAATVYDVMSGLASPGDAVGKAMFKSRGNANPKYYGVDCMAGDKRLENESLLSGIDAAAFRDTLAEYSEAEGYSWMLVDMPPSNMWVNDIVLSGVVDYLIIPFSADVYSVSGYADVMDTVQRARSMNPQLNVIGIYLSRYCTISVQKYVRDKLEEFGEIFINIQIPNSADLQESIMMGSPISYYRQFSKSRTAYEQLVAEVTRRVKRMGGDA